MGQEVDEQQSQWQSDEDPLGHAPPVDGRSLLFRGVDHFVKAGEEVADATAPRGFGSHLFRRLQYAHELPGTRLKWGNLEGIERILASTIGTFDLVAKLGPGRPQLGLGGLN